MCSDLSLFKHSNEMTIVIEPPTFWYRLTAECANQLRHGGVHLEVTKVLSSVEILV